jgi:hypothetical protein
MEIIVNNMTGYEEGSDRFQIGRIRVWPGKTRSYTAEEIRKYIRHPLGNIKFRATIYDSVEWPFDQFTKRRIKDGTVLTEAPDQWPVSTEPNGDDLDLEPPKPLDGDAPEA